MNYIYALTYVDFDQENKDVVYFTNQSEKDSYFGLSSLFDSTNKNEINFEKRNLIDITLTIATTDSNAIDDEFGFNYCILKEKSSNKYYFYFINKVMYDNLGRMRINCHMDIFTTYFDSTIFEGIINRGTLREFVKDTDSTDIIYDTKNYSHVFSVDDTYEGKKFIQYDKVLQPHIVTNNNNATIDSWLEENVEAWQYLYVDCYHRFTYKENLLDQQHYVTNFMSNGISTSFGVLAQPIYIYANKRMYVRFTDVSDPNDPVTHNFELKESAIDEFRQYNNDNAFVYSSKLSKQPPFTPFEENTTPLDAMRFLCNIVVESGNLYFDFGNVTNINQVQLFQVNSNIHWVNLNFTDDSLSNCMVEMTYQTKRFYNNNVSSIVNSYMQTRMTKAKYLSNSTEFWKYPNSTSLKNIELKITYNGQEYSTSPSKLDTGEAIIEMLEAISTDISKTYVRWKYTGYYCFRSYNSKTLTGGIFNDDTSITLGSSKLAETLAQSKNFFMQRQLNIGTNFLLGLGSSIAKQDALGVAKGMAKTQLDEVNYGFEVDNIENAPSHLQKASGNGLFNMLTKDYGLHLEVWMMTDEDLTNIAQYYNMYGVQTNTYGSMLDIIKKHKYFDYVEMTCQYIKSSVNTMNLPLEVREEFRRKLKRGVRFWYSDLYNYTKYNYERSLE